MTEHTLAFLSAFLLFVASLVVTSVVYLRRARRVSRDDVGALLARLQAVDRGNLAHVATAWEDDETLEPQHIWELAGGLSGIEALAANCDVLIDLACHVQGWYPEALPVTEQLRLNAREIQWHLERLRAAEGRGHGRAAYPEYAQRAVATYVRMTRHVLDLYEATGVPGLPELQSVL